MRSRVLRSSTRSLRHLEFLLSAAQMAGQLFSRLRSSSPHGRTATIVRVPSTSCLWPQVMQVQPEAGVIDMPLSSPTVLPLFHPTFCFLVPSRYRVTEFATGKKRAWRRFAFVPAESRLTCFQNLVKGSSTVSEVSWVRIVSTQGAAVREKCEGYQKGMHIRVTVVLASKIKWKLGWRSVLTLRSTFSYFLPDKFIIT